MTECTNCGSKRAYVGLHEVVCKRPDCIFYPRNRALPPNVLPGVIALWKAFDAATTFADQKKYREELDAIYEEHGL